MPKITIIGLGLIGTAIGLALKQQDGSYTIVGHDKDGDAAVRAKQRDAVDKTHWNLISAADDADMVILSIPTAAIRPTLDALAEDLKPGCLIMDTAPIKAPVLDAAEALPDNVHYISTNPILTGGQVTRVEDASATLFDEVPWAICPTTSTHPDAIQVAADFVSAIGAQPVFLDPEEHDGLVAAVDGMPTVVAASVTNTVAGSQAWREIRRLAGAQFDAVGYLPDFEPQDFSEAVLANSTNIAHWVDVLIAELNDWRTDLMAADREAIEKRFELAIDKRSQWLKARSRGDWEEPDRVEDTPSFWKRMIGIGGRSSDES